MWTIPLSNTCFDHTDTSAVHDVLQSGWVSMGAHTKEFERRFAQFIGVRHAIAVTNGTAALHLANSALGIRQGLEVICPALTFVATANAIVYAGAKPVFADIQGDTDLNISPASIEDRISDSTRAIVVVHYAGYPCDMNAILAIAQRHNLHVIEDCAHAPGASTGGKRCGSIGDVGCFSFFANKNMTTAEGGMITTNNDMLARRIRNMRSHGMTSTTSDRHKGKSFSYDVTELGYNYRIDELRSALGLAQLGKLPHWNTLRKALSNRYFELLSSIDALTIPFLKTEGESVNHIFPILLRREERRKDFMTFLKSHGIQTSIHYPAVHLFDYYRRSYGCRTGMLPKTEQVSCREVTLPLSPDMKTGDVEYVCSIIKAYFNSCEAHTGIRVPAGI